MIITTIPTTECFTLLHKDTSQPMHGKSFFGLPAATKPKLLVYNEELGYDVFITVNRTDGVGRRADNIVEARYFYADWDNGIPQNVGWFMAPSVVIQSSPGRYQAYWALEKPTKDFGTWQRIQNCVVRKTNGDMNAKDLARVLRAPYYLNHKRAEPFRVVPSMISDKLYSVADMQNAFGIDPVGTPPGSQLVSAEAFPPEEIRLKRWKAWLRNCSKPGIGERNGWLFRVAAKGVHDFAVDPGDVEDVLIDLWYVSHLGDDNHGIETIVRNAVRSGTGTRGIMYAGPQFELEAE